MRTNLPLLTSERRHSKQVGSLAAASRVARSAAVSLSVTPARAEATVSDRNLWRTRSSSSRRETHTHATRTGFFQQALALADARFVGLIALAALAVELGGATGQLVVDLLLLGARVFESLRRVGGLAPIAVQLPLRSGGHLAPSQKIPHSR